MPYEFKQTRRVEFPDTDAGGIVHFSNYFRYMESAEHSFYRSLGLHVHHHQGEKVVGWPRVAASCEYKAPLRFEDEVEVHLIVTEKGEKSLTYVAVFTRVEGGERTEVARGSVTVVSVAIDPAKKTIESVPIPRDFDAKIEAAPPDRVPK